MKQPLDHLRSRKKPVSRPCWITLNQDLADQLAEAEMRARQLRERAEKTPKDTVLESRADEAQEEVERLREEMRHPANTAKFVAKSLGREEFEDLQNDHLATPDQKKQAKKDGVGDLSWNPDTFPPALIQECVVYAYDRDLETGELFGDDPETGEPIERHETLDDAFVKELWRGTDDDGVPKWNHAEVMGLFSVAFEVNQTRRVVDLGNGSRRTRS